MKNISKTKLIIGIAAAAALLSAAIVLVVRLAGSSENYRDISVFELNAAATVTRDGTALDAYQGMKLENGDDVKVGDDGYICLLLDNDKYVTLETGTEIRLHATGDAAAGKTRIELVSGAVLNELDNKLNADSSYELSTPTSVMAVRGTVFRTALTTKGEAANTELIVLDGQVAAAAVLADGTVSSDEILVNAGEAASFERMDADSDPAYSPIEISYGNLPADTLANILKIYEKGRLSSLSISREDLEQLAQKGGNPAAAPESSANKGSSATATDTPDGSANEGSSTTTADTPDGSANAGSSASPNGNSDDDTATRANTESTDKPSDDPATKPGSQSTAKPSSRTTAKPNPKSTAKPSSRTTAKPSSKPTAKPSSRTTAKPSSQPTAKPSSQPTAKPSNSPSVPATPKPHDTVCKVTFLDASGKVFGTQSVTYGERAMKPLLSPIGGTNWCDAQGSVFDFGTAITKDVTLYYR